MKGYISEVIVFNTALTNDQYIKVNHYLSTKWGLEDVVDSDSDGTMDNNDSAPYDPSITIYSDIDDDNDGVVDVDDKFPLDAAAYLDSDDDGYPDSFLGGATTLSDGTPVDAFPNDASENTDTDGDGVGDNSDAFVADSAGAADSDNDGYPDELLGGSAALSNGNVADDFPNDSTAYLDADGDGYADAFLGDATALSNGNELDVFPADANEHYDTDGDGTGDVADLDDDDDGYSDLDETTNCLENNDPFDALDTPTDTDGDLSCNALDTDDDDDGIADTSDAYPLDNSAATDTDGDGAPDTFFDGFTTLLDGTTTVDLDDDNDNYSDLDETTNCLEGNDPLDSSNIPTDTDGDLSCNALDDDDDNDGVGDGSDAFPLDDAAAVDTDGDGYPDAFFGSDTALLNGNTIDQVPDDSAAYVDTDGDGYPNSFLGDATVLSNGNVVDNFPNDSAAYLDADGDGYADTFLGGAVALSNGNELDVFPADANEHYDNDGDGTGDVADLDDDDDGYSDLDETTNCLENNDPFDALDTPTDTDGDLSCNALDADDDDDGVADTSDVYPLDNSAATDTDGDGAPDTFFDGFTTLLDGTTTVDLDDDNDNYSDLDETTNCLEGNDPLDSSNIPTDTDGDLSCNTLDDDDDNDGVVDGSDAFPLDDAAAVDTDGDGYPDAFFGSDTALLNGNTIDQVPDDSAAYVDTDGDGYPNSFLGDATVLSNGNVVDNFPNDSAAYLDADGDGYADTFLGGAVALSNGNELDVFPADANEHYDNDGDGTGDVADLDDDDDGYSDLDETTNCLENNDPFDALDTPTDTDGDLSCNALDADDDDDGVADTSDVYPLDNSAATDTDGDGAPDTFFDGFTTLLDGTTVDLDDDNDGYSDLDETTNCLESNDPLNSADTPTDTDGDLSCNTLDDDDDNDGVVDSEDVFPLDVNEYIDTDNDGVGDNGDKFPTDPAASVDADGDLFPDEWNAGMSAANSVTNLHLDANASNSNVAVDFASKIPEFVAASKRSGLVGWYYGTSESIQEKDGSVKRWMNLVSSGKNLQQTDRALMPNFNSTEGSVTFTGGQYLKLDELKPNESTIIVVTKGIGDVLGDSSTYLALSEGAASIGTSEVSNNNESQANALITANQKSVYVIKSNSNSVEFKIGHNSQISKTLVANRKAADTFYVGKSGQPGVISFEGDVYELLIYNRILTKSELDEIQSDLALRYDIQFIKAKEVMVDTTFSGEALGTTERPFTQLSNARARIGSGGTLKLKGEYKQGLSITENIVIESSGETVIFGIPKDEQ